MRFQGLCPDTPGGFEVVRWRSEVVRGSSGFSDLGGRRFDPSGEVSPKLNSEIRMIDTRETPSGAPKEKGYPPETLRQRYRVGTGLWREPERLGHQRGNRPRGDNLSGIRTGEMDETTPLSIAISGKAATPGLWAEYHLEVEAWMN